MRDLVKLRAKINELAENKTKLVWYKLEKIGNELIEETWQEDLNYAWEAERLHRFINSICIEIFQNHLSELEQEEITQYTQDKIDRGLL